MSEIDEQAAELARVKTPSGVADRGVTKAKPVRPASRPAESLYPDATCRYRPELLSAG
jgi:hypothetical protein